MPHSAIHLTCIKQLLVLENLLSFLSGRFRHVLLLCIFKINFLISLLKHMLLELKRISPNERTKDEFSLMDMEIIAILH